MRGDNLRNKPSKRGFTLIELLAVIVILAVIALIAIPQVIKILNKARISAAEDTTSGIVKSAENYVADFMLKNKGIIPAGDLKFECSDNSCSMSQELLDSLVEYNLDGLDKLDIKGTIPKSGIVVIKNSGKQIVVSDLKINNFTCNNINGKSKCDTLNRYKEEDLNGADPVIDGDLVPVKIESDGTVKKADLENAWYNYTNKEWANAVILKTNKEYKNEEVIPEENIKQYYVWIPRYKYQLWNVGSGTLDSDSNYPNGTSESPINIVFEGVTTEESKGNQNGEWLTHPAFTNFGTNGIWVGKFETSYDEETFTNKDTFLTTNTKYNLATDSSKIIVKPNVRSLTTKSVSQFYTLSKNTDEELNSHMMTNMEWGAATYLTYSVYGKCNSTSCEEEYINNVNTGYYVDGNQKFTGQWSYGATITGCSGETIGASVMSNMNSCESGNTYIEAKASTTGNITGIYDMSGGNSEYVMGVITINNKLVSGRHNKWNSGFNGIYSAPGNNDSDSTQLEKTNGIDYPDSKYYNLYPYKYGFNTNERYDYTSGLLGDATKEIANTKTNASSGNTGLWFSDSAVFPTAVNPWFLRGGYFELGGRTGVFNFSPGPGLTYSYYSSRLVLAY